MALASSWSPHSSSAPTTGYFANRTADLGRSDTSKLVLGALLLGGLALVLVALEGIVCLILASPLAIAIAVVGGLLGRAIAVHARHPPRHALSGLALLPLVFAAETMLPAAVTFESRSTIRIAAPPEAVWPVLLRTDLSQEPVGLPFRLGVAYPLHGETLGEGIGAMRLRHIFNGDGARRGHAVGAQPQAGVRHARRAPGHA